MGVYRKFKDKDPRKFLERFSKNLPSPEEKPAPRSPAGREKSLPKKEEEIYTAPAPRAAMDYVALEKKCQEFLLGMIEEADFRIILQQDKERLKKFSKGFDNFKFNEKGLSWERELQIKNLFIKSAKEYNEGLNYFEKYLAGKKKSFMKSGLKLITSAGKRLAFVKSLADKGKEEVKAEMKRYLEELAAKEQEKIPAEEPPAVSSLPDYPPESLTIPPPKDFEDFIPSPDHVPESPAPIPAQAEKKDKPSHDFAASPRENIRFSPASAPPEHIEKEIDINILSSFPVFSGLEPSQLEEIKQSMELCLYPQDRIIYREGMEADKVYILLGGEIILYKAMTLSPDKFEVIDYITPGDIMGDTGVIDSGPRAANARVISDEAKVYTVSREDFLSFIARFPRLSHNLNRIYCARLREALQRLVH